MASAIDRSPLTPNLEVTQLSGSLGAEIRGITLTEVGPDEAATILDLLHEHLVIFFPDQALTPDEHITFGGNFGRLEGHPNLALDSERPEFFELKAVGGAGAVADEWHSDLTCEAEPSIYAILHMKKCPEFGGDTLWANMYRAYDSLSQPLKDLCEGLSALHDAGPHHVPDRKAIHPVVRTHPVTGRKSLFVNHHFTRRIVEMSHDESEAFLAYLTRHATEDRFTVRYHWTAGTIAMWDNRCTQHHVLNDFEGERIIQRVTVMGDKVEAAAKSHYAPFDEKYSAATWRDEPLRKFLRDR